jgi:hypothetical protein
MKEDYEIKVTNINKKYHARLLNNKVVINEMSCDLKEDIGYICREILRWACKMGSIDKFASSARERQTTSPKGKITYIGVNK